MKKKDEIRGLSIDKIEQELQALENQYVQIKMQIEAGQEKNNSKFKKIKKNIAQLKTIRTEKLKNKVK